MLAVRLLQEVQKVCGVHVVTRVRLRGKVLASPLTTTLSIYVSSLHAKSYFDPIVRKKFMTGFVHPTSTCLSEYNYSLVAVIHPISPDTDR